MEITVKRKTRTDISTIGELDINGTFECYTLEDKDRGLLQTMSLTDIKSKKVDGKTAIPAGRYELAITFSDRFQKYLPLLLNVPGYEGVRIHNGNTAADTEGCLLLGTSVDKDFVGNSKSALQSFLSKLTPASKKEKIFITIS